MFWKGRVSTVSQIMSYLQGHEITLANDLIKATANPIKNKVCSVRPASVKDSEGIAKLLNEWFEPRHTRSKVAVTSEWVRRSFLEDHALWIVAKDLRGTVRGCVSSFRIGSPYPSTIGSNTCGQSSMREWGLIDWYCVHPLWREKGVGSDLLSIMDYITYTIRRRAHVFLKEGMPLLQLPIYSTFLKVRRAGNSNVKHMREGTGLIVFPYQCNDSITGRFRESSDIFI